MRIFMQKQDNNYEILIGYARSMLGYSFEELKRNYISYPISITVYVDKKTNTFEKIIEVRFDNQEATISCSFNEADKCDTTYLFFDSLSSENSLIRYLSKSFGFDYRENHWLLDNCYLKIKQSKDFFCFYIFVDR